MTSAELTSKLDQILRRTQRWVALEGLSQLALAFAAALIGLIALDWWVHMPAFLRGAATVAGLWLAVAWLAQRVVRPLRRPVPLQEIAMRVDRIRSDLGDRLATAVERLDAPEGTGNVLWRRVVEQALLAAESVPWNRLVDSRRAKRLSGLALLIIVCLAGAVRLWPDTASTGVQRLLWPIGRAEWPRSVEIDALSSDLIVAAGEPVDVRMRIRRGASNNLRAWVVWRETKGTGAEIRRELMSADEDGVFRQTNASVRSDTSYWFEAGDDSTADHPGHIRVVQRPSVARVMLRLKPPQYAAVLGESVQSLQEGRAVALAGSRGTIDVEVTKPIGQDARGRASIALRDAAGTEYQFREDKQRSSSARSWRADLDIRQALSLRLELTDNEGLGLRTTPLYRIDIRPDAPPTVAITRPSHMLEVSPAAQVDVVALAQDDIDVTRVSLRARIADGRDLSARELWAGSAREENAKAKSAGAATEANANSGPGDPSEPVRISVSLRWSLAEYRLAPGAVVEYWAEATDGYELDGHKHPAATSAVMRLRVLSPEEFAERIRDESLALIQQLRQLATEQDSLRHDTAAAAVGRATSQPAVSDALLRRQRSLNSRASEVSQRFKALKERMQRNQSDDAGGQREAEATANELRDVQQGPMAQAAGALAKAAANDGRDSQLAPQLSQAAEFQSAALQALRHMLAGLEKAGDFDGVVRKSRDLLDRQEELTRASAAAAQESAGVEADALSPTQRGRLSELSNRQDSLARELKDLMTRLDQLAHELTHQDKAAADALARAREAIERETVSQRMREATEAVRQNHGNRAAEAQGAAERGLRSMLSALSERVDRKLAELSKQLADVAERLERLIRAQEDLIARTQSSGKQLDAATAVPALATRQSTLKRTAVQIAEQIRTTGGGKIDKSGAGPAKLMDQSGAKMDEAAAKLTAADAGEAISRQVAAVDLLHQAAEALAAAQAAADQEIAARALEALKQSLGEIRTAQLQLVEKSELVRKRYEKEKRLTRPDGISLNKLAVEQAELAERLQSIREKMTNSVVYNFVCGRANEQMKHAAEFLKSHQPAEAVNAERAAADELGRLIDGLDDPDAKANKFASEDDASGGGGGPSGARRERPIPPLAELKLLRALQADLNAAVKRFDAKVPPADARTETELHQAEELGKRQQEIHDLATKLVGK